MTSKLVFTNTCLYLMSVAVLGVSSAKVGGWDTAPNTQYHIQTDEGPERYFKYQTISGQYRKEKRLQDGTVVGTYGWVDPNGFLRLRDYIADDKGYRIVRTKKVLVGVETPISNAVSLAKKVPSQGGVGLQPTKVPYATTVSPISLSDHLKQSQYSDYPTSTESSGIRQPIVVISPNSYYPSSQNVPPYSSTAFPTTTPAPYFEPPHRQQIEPQTFRPYYNPNSLQSYYPQDSNRRVFNNVGAHKYDSGSAQSQQFPLYDGVSMTHNGFRYYLPRHYHEEENLPGEKRAGSFGYIDPFGIRRVIYYNSDPTSGFVHRKNNRYVGFDATPYDPRF